MDTVLENMKERRSVRSYKSGLVPDELVGKVIEAGLCAASGMNRQSAIIVNVKNKELRDRLMRMNASIMGREGSDPFYGAPNVLIVLADKNMLTYIYDGSLVMGNMMLEAHNLGLGSCWVHRAKEEFESEEGKGILRSLGIGENYEGIGHLILGYTDGEYPAPKEIKSGRVFTAD